MKIDWTEIQAIANSALVLTSAGAIGYAALQLRHEREYRSVNNLEKQLSFFLGDSFVAARRRLAQARIGAEGLRPLSVDDPPIAAFEVLDFYEHLGLLVKKGHLNVYDVWHTFYEWAQPVYVDLQPMIENPDSDFSDHYTDLRKLVRSMDEIQMKRMHAKNANHWALWTPDRILGYYRYELDVQAGEHQRPRFRAQPAPVPVPDPSVLREDEVA
ncbi:MAG TPA: hypothetical protein VM865_07865 [Acidobacteriaceae bacterium]|nr:hypothetical protein [Acidobacteriaceae bacterium]